MFDLPAAFVSFVLMGCFLGYKVCEEHQRSREAKAAKLPVWDYEPGR